MVSKLQEIQLITDAIDRAVRNVSPVLQTYAQTLDTQRGRVIVTFGDTPTGRLVVTSLAEGRNGLVAATLNVNHAQLHLETIKKKLMGI
jgi:hypothetical protein